jgi:hypothetical protein
LLLFLLPFTWGRHRRARATTALPVASSLYTCSSMYVPRCIFVFVLGESSMLLARSINMTVTDLV